MPGWDDPPAEPFCVLDQHGHDVLVQIVGSGFQPPAPPALNQPQNIRFTLTRVRVVSPNGHSVEVWAPLQAAFSPTNMQWLMLSDGRLALVHKLGPSNPTGWGRPLLGHQRPMHPALPQAGFPPYIGAAALSPEMNNLRSQIESTIEIRRMELAMQKLPGIPALAIPAGPTIPELPQDEARRILLT